MRLIQCYKIASKKSIEMWLEFAIFVGGVLWWTKLKKKRLTTHKKTTQFDYVKWYKCIFGQKTTRRIREWWGKRHRTASHIGSKKMVERSIMTTIELKYFEVLTKIEVLQIRISVAPIDDIWSDAWEPNLCSQGEGDEKNWSL